MQTDISSEAVREACLWSVASAALAAWCGPVTVSLRGAASGLSATMVLMALRGRGTVCLDGAESLQRLGSPPARSEAWNTILATPRPGLFRRSGHGGVRLTCIGVSSGDTAARPLLGERAEFVLRSGADGTGLTLTAAGERNQQVAERLRARLVAAGAAFDRLAPRADRISFETLTDVCNLERLYLECLVQIGLVEADARR